MNPSLKRFTRNSYPGVLCAAVILLLTGLPGSCLPKVKPVLGADKIIHLLMYAGFAFATLWGYREHFQRNGERYRRKACWITLIIGIAYGALTEIMQELFIPGRVGNVYDWVADVIGSVIGVVLAYFLLRDGNNLRNETFCK